MGRAAVPLAGGIPQHHHPSAVGFPAGHTALCKASRGRVPWEAEGLLGLLSPGQGLTAFPYTSRAVLGAICFGWLNSHLKSQLRNHMV